MKVACPKCHKDFPVPSDIISRGVARVNCESCGFGFVIRLGDPNAAAKQQQKKKTPSEPIKIEGLKSSNSTMSVAGEIGTHQQRIGSTDTQTSVKLDPELMQEMAQAAPEITIAATKVRADDSTEPEIVPPPVLNKESPPAPQTEPPPAMADTEQIPAPSTADTAQVPLPPAMADTEQVPVQDSAQTPAMADTMPITTLPQKSAEETPAEAETDKAATQAPEPGKEAPAEAKESAPAQGADDGFESYRSPDKIDVPPEIAATTERRDETQPGWAGSKELAPSLKSAPTLTETVSEEAEAQAPTSGAPVPPEAGPLTPGASLPPEEPPLANEPPAAPVAAPPPAPAAGPPPAPPSAPAAGPQPAAAGGLAVSVPPAGLQPAVPGMPPGAVPGAMPPGYPPPGAQMAPPSFAYGAPGQIDAALQNYALPEPTTSKGVKVLGMLMMLVVVCCSLLFLYVLMQNNWSFDLADFGSMVQRAFGGGTQKKGNRQLRGLLLSEHMEEPSALAGNQQVLAVKGVVKNNDTLPRRYVYLRAILQDKHGRTITTAEAPAGNTFPAEELAQMTPAQLNARITPGGQQGKNLRFMPGDSLPFMVVITRLPANYSREKYSVLVQVSKAEILEDE